MNDPKNHENKFLPNPELEKQNMKSKIFICTKCGECCHIREKKNISEEEERKYHLYMYKKFGIIYLAKLSEITINVWPEEKDLLEAEAKKRGIKILLRPKRAFYDSKDNALVILDYFIDHGICPFFDRKEKKCTVYNIRPLICQSYPLLTTKTLGKCKYKKIDVNHYDSEKKPALELEKRTSIIKNTIKDLIDKGHIDVKINPQSINSMNPKIRELRLK
ncbi:MAG: YkgJ family cysteine cluster protein [Candidatus Woesearchaeota archaeon]